MILRDCGTCSVSSLVLKFKSSRYKLFLRRQWFTVEECYCHCYQHINPLHLHIKNSQINYSILGFLSSTLPPFLCLSVFLLAVTHTKAGVKLFHRVSGFYYQICQLWSSYYTQILKLFYYFVYYLQFYGEVSTNSKKHSFSQECNAVNELHPWSALWASGLSTGGSHLVIILKLHQRNSNWGTTVKGRIATWKYTCKGRSYYKTQKKCFYINATSLNLSNIKKSEWFPQMQCYWAKKTIKATTYKQPASS